MSRVCQGIRSAMAIRQAAAVVVLSLCVLAFCVPSAFGAGPGWKVIAATGPTNLPPVNSEVQKVAVDATGGTFALAFGGQTTVPLAFDAETGEVESALEALSTIGGAGGSVEVGGGPGSLGATNPYVVRFRGALAATDVSQMTADGSQLTGGAGTVAVTTHVVGATPGTGTLAVYVTNVGGGASVGTTTLTVGPLPAGVQTADTSTGTGWSCAPAGAGASSVVCQHAGTIPALTAAEPVRVPLRVTTTTPFSSTVQVVVDGGGALPDPTGGNVYTTSVKVSEERVAAGVQAIWAGAFDVNGRPATQAGGHPHAAGTTFLFNTNLNTFGNPVPAGDPRDVIVDLPPGFIGNPLVTHRCPRVQGAGPAADDGGEAYCGVDTSRVGYGSPITHFFGTPSGQRHLLNGVAPPGHAARLSFKIVDANGSVFASLRGDDDFGVRTLSPNIPTVFRIFGAAVMLEGSPVAAGGKAFLTGSTGCGFEASKGPVVSIMSSSWQAPALFDSSVVDIPPVVGCENLEFGTDDVPVGFSMKPDSGRAASPTAVSAHLEVDQAGLVDPDRLAAPHLKRSVVVLPEGFAPNPALADGLEACSTDQMGLVTTVGAMPTPIRFDKSSPRCPDGSKLGSVEVETPVIDHTLKGVIYQAAQGDNPFGSLLAVYIVVDDPETGTMVKLAGRVDPDPATGRLTAVFDHGPQAPFTDLKLSFKGGERSVLATPDTCGEHRVDGTWTPWSAPESGPPAQTSEAFTTTTGPGGSACATNRAALPFSPGFEAGVTRVQAREHSEFSMTVSRKDGEKELRSIQSVNLPEGLLGNVASVPLCSDADADTGTCPAASRIGHVQAAAGVGTTPLWIPQQGKPPTGVYLTGRYRGAPYGLSVTVPAQAGPFDLGRVVVRSALHIDPRTAKITAGVDQTRIYTKNGQLDQTLEGDLPRLLEGILLRQREIRVVIDRQRFLINPSNCTEQQITAQIHSFDNGQTDTTNRFKIGNCAKLPFKPKLTLALTGRKQTTTGKHPGIHAQVTQTGTKEAGIKKAEVRLPKSLALDPNNAQALCEHTNGTKPDLENHCPKGSIVGRARATTPLLKHPLAGNVYFVKNIRTDPNTGNQIRTLPMIIAALRGEVAINLKGESDVKTGKLVSTFTEIPDAPITKFNMNINGGRNGILTITRTRRAQINLCAKPRRQIAESNMNAHNGRRHDTNTPMKTPCTKHQVKNAKRTTKKAARKARQERGR